MASTRRAGALALGACAVACLVPVAVADVYMHNPRGSNNRLNEQSANRNNANRLFDSQNNNKGGYNVGDQGADASSSEDEHGVLTYYSGSKLCMEWTNQHGCGAGTQGKTECQMVIQYTCAGPESKTCVDGTEEIRDGTDEAEGQAGGLQLARTLMRAGGRAAAHTYHCSSHADLPRRTKTANRVLLSFPCLSALALPCWPPKRTHWR